ncbi:MAG: methylated-DNA--[protein]-cysteine S-methyltransferase, partial [Burkholderiales bacterium]|nr:methylated-DNA--[protein]-cysteine S-methyltransferase [Burkholderiales bacterium]
RQVWAEVASIAYGETTTYAAIAARIGRPNAARAVGAANAANPLPLFVPCHRVLGADGQLRGYG